MLNGNNKYTVAVTSTYDILTCFELSAPRNHCTGCTGDRGNRNYCGGNGWRDHTFIQHNAPSGTVFIPGLDDRKLYRIKCFNDEKWGRYGNQWPEATCDNTPNKSGYKLAQILRCLTKGRSDYVLNKNWLLLDSHFTNSCTKNDTIVSNVIVSSTAEHIWVYSNRGQLEYTMKGTLYIFPMHIHGKK